MPRYVTLRKACKNEILPWRRLYRFTGNWYLSHSRPEILTWKWLVAASCGLEIYWSCGLGGLLISIVPERIGYVSDWSLQRMIVGSGQMWGKVGVVKGCDVLVESPLPVFDGRRTDEILSWLTIETLLTAEMISVMMIMMILIAMCVSGFFKAQFMNPSKLTATWLSK